MFTENKQIIECFNENINDVDQIALGDYYFMTDYVKKN